VVKQDIHVYKQRQVNNFLFYVRWTANNLKPFGVHYDNGKGDRSDITNDVT